MDLGRPNEPRGNPGLAASRAGDSGCPKRYRGGHARHRQERALCLARALRPATSVIHASGTRRAQAGACRLRLARPPLRQRSGEADATGVDWTPASSGAKAPLACEDRWLAGCARVSFAVAEVGERRRGPEKRDSRWQRGAWTGTQPRQSPQGTVGGQRRREPVLRWPSRGTGKGPSRALERALRGDGLRSTEGTSGCPPERFVHANELAAASAALAGLSDARASGTTRGRRQKYQRWVRTRHDGKTTPAMASRQCRVQIAEANCSDVESDNFPRVRHGAQAPWTHEGTSEARVLVRDSEMAEVGPTHRAPRRLASRKASSTPRR